MNTWFWSAVFHSRVVELTQKLDYSSAVALLGYSLIIATIRAFNVRLEAPRAMVAAPIIAFTSTHLLYLNFYQFDYGLNMIVCTAMGILKLILWAVWAGVIVCTAMGILKLILWAVWAGVTQQSASILLETIGRGFGGAISMILEIYDIPLYWGLVDAYALFIQPRCLSTYLLWSFARDDSEVRTSMLIKKTK